MSTVRLHRRSAAAWASKNPILAKGEPGYDTTNKSLKVGDGITPWNNLLYVSSGTQESSTESALIECQVTGGISPAVDRSPYSGVLVAGVDHIAHKKSLSFMVHTESPNAMQVTMKLKRGELPVITPEQLTAIGALDGYSVSDTTVNIMKIDVLGAQARLGFTAIRPPDDQPLAFELLSAVDDHGVTVAVPGESFVLEAGTYFVRVQYSLDVWWG